MQVQFVADVDRRTRGTMERLLNCRRIWRIASERRGGAVDLVRGFHWKLFRRNSAEHTFKVRQHERPVSQSSVVTREWEG